jgi:DnaJ-class molecular chaperone
LNHYQTLGVPEDVEPATLKKAFRKIARECHPDVAGDDPKCAARFKVAREAFETLSDSERRARYDRRRRRVGGRPGAGSFFDAFYRATGKSKPPRSSTTARKATAATGEKGRGNDVNLEDLFDDFGDFGFGRSKPQSTFTQSTSTAEDDPRARRGEDVRLDMEVPASLAKQGGSIPLSYERLERVDTWSPGAEDAGLISVQDVLEVRVIPGTCDGEILREKGRGNAGPHGGPPGDLVLLICLVGEETPRTPPVPGVVEVTLGEALLGGTVTVQSPTGPVAIDIPAGTSGGTRLRLKGKGPSGTDWYVVTRIHVPAELDEEGRELARKLAERYPGGR